MCWWSREALAYATFWCPWVLGREGELHSRRLHSYISDVVRGAEGTQDLLQEKADNVRRGFWEGRLGVCHILDLAPLPGWEMMVMRRFGEALASRSPFSLLVPSTDSQEDSEVWVLVDALCLYSDSLAEIWFKGERCTCLLRCHPVLLQVIFPSFLNSFFILFFFFESGSYEV